MLSRFLRQLTLIMWSMLVIALLFHLIKLKYLYRILDKTRPQKNVKSSLAHDQRQIATAHDASLAITHGRAIPRE